MTWTPGPWKYKEVRWNTSTEENALNGGLVVGPDLDNGGMYLNPADARLIACAPEMAELLQTICSNLDSWHLAGKSMLRPEEDFVYKTARDLLARARGEDA